MTTKNPEGQREWQFQFLSVYLCALCGQSCLNACTKKDWG
jgi:hypothetical protein